MATPHFPDRALGSSRVSPRAATADDRPVQPATVHPLVVPRATVRCECTRCGAHVEVLRSWQIAGWCQNCGGYDLRALSAVGPAAPLDPAPALPVALPPARVA